MRVVVDTNVLYAAFVSREGLCARLVESLFSSHALITSEYILDELSESLSKKQRLSIALLETYVAFVRSSSTVVVPERVSAPGLEDPDDIPVLGTAVAGRADAIVTGDRAFQSLGRFESINVLSPRALSERIRAV